jgi:hypothetical protein
MDVLVGNLPSANNMNGFSSTESLPLATRMYPLGSAPRSYIEFQPATHMHASRSLASQNWSQAGYEDDPVDAYSLASSVAVTSEGYPSQYSMTETDRTWTATLSERPAFNASYYEPETVVAYSTSIPLPLSQAHIMSGPGHRIVQSAVAGDRVLPMPPVLRPRYSKPANPIEMSAKSITASLQPLMSFYPRSSISWANDDNGYDSHSNSSVNSGSTDDLSSLTTKPLNASSRSGLVSPHFSVASSSTVLEYSAASTVSEPSPTSSLLPSAHSVVESSDTTFAASHDLAKNQSPTALYSYDRYEHKSRRRRPSVMDSDKYAATEYCTVVSSQSDKKLTSKPKSAD